jgi:adenosylhomocysteine nucleosidase
MDAHRNVGALNYGSGGVTVHGDAVGEQTITYGGPTTLRPASEPVPPSTQRQPGRADVGILTVLHQEAHAVVNLLQRRPDYRAYQLIGGAQMHEASFTTPAGVVRVVSMQTLDRGPRSASIAYHQIRQRFAPPVVLLVGIAGGIDDSVAIGDVVISDEVIYYDARRETTAGVRRRGQSHAMAAVLRHRINEYFRSHGETMRVSSGAAIRVHRGPIGSGDAVVTNADADIRRFLRLFHEKTLAVETEAAGLAQAFYEEVDLDISLRGWLTIRGISDHADHAKGTEYHETASQHAAEVLEQVLPFLLLSQP